MSLSTFSFPTTVLYGAGALALLKDRLITLKVSRPLVVTDPGLLKTSSFAALENLLGVESRGRTWHLFHEVRPNPVEAEAKSAARVFREQKCDGVIAIGGGSALDVGKACRLWIEEPELQAGKFDYAADWSGLAPLICIPTTAGTGSEVGRSSVLIAESTGRKTVLFQPELLAKLVILDPELTRSLPPILTAATGLDALTHCIESFTSPVFHPICDGVALEGIHLIVDALPRAVNQGDDLEARGRMLVAASMGAIAFQKDLGATHSLAHPLSSICGMHHGTANAVCLPHVMRWNAARKPGVYRRIGVTCGLEVGRTTDAEADRQTVEFIAKFIRELGLLDRLRDYGVKSSHLVALAAEAYEDSCHKTNPVPVTREDLRALYELAL